jgi:hypothetical protein
LAPATVRLRRDQIHSAVTAAVAAGVAPENLRSLADLIELANFKVIMRKLYEDDGSVLTPYTHGVAGTLIAIAKEWVEASADQIATLKKLRRKLGTLPSGLTDKNKSFCGDLTMLSFSIRSSTFLISCGGMAAAASQNRSVRSSTYRHRSQSTFCWRVRFG